MSIKREKLIKRIERLKARLEEEDLILSDPEEEFLDRLVWSIQEFLKLVS